MAWTENQIKYIHFLARGKQDKHGRTFTEDEFAKIIGVDFSTLWRWKQKDGFAEALLIATQKELAPYLPSISRGLIGKAGGNKKFKNIDVPAANLAIKLMGVVLEKSQVESKVDAEIKADVTLKPMSDAELDAIIQAGVGG